jgi:formate hydrogenlyase subunit 4
LKLVLYMSLVICLFLPFGMASAGAGPSAWLFGIGAFLGKLAVSAVILGAWETSIAKMRVFRVGEFLGGAFVFAFLAILLAFVSREVLK